jgi:plasmid stabilization system protein ParE
VAARIDHTLQAISQFPHAGRLDAETGAREWVVPGLPLLIIYVTSDDLIEVIAVFHTARDPETKRRP